MRRATLLAAAAAAASATAHGIAASAALAAAAGGRFALHADGSCDAHDVACVIAASAPPAWVAR
jgi:hypothetical protein